MRISRKIVGDKGKSLAILSLVLGAASLCSAAGTIYDAAADFEQGWTTHSNPNGVWSYGYSSDFANPFTLYTKTTQGLFNAPNTLDQLSPSVNINESLRRSSITAQPMLEVAAMLIFWQTN